MTERPRWVLGIAAAMLLAASMPPAWFPGAELLVLAGLGAFYAVATSSARPLLVGYAIGVVFLAQVSWSLRFTAGWATVAIVALGAVYYLLVVLWTRVAPGEGTRAVWFAAGIASTAWLRAHAPEIQYPHAQPAHALFEWTGLLGPVRWGGEVLANFVVAWAAAAAVDLYRSWRVGRPAWRDAWIRAAGAAGAWLLPCAVGPPGAAPGEPATVEVAAIEPGPDVVWDFRGRSEALLRDRLIRPTLELAGPGAGDAPDLVLWPESCLPSYWVRDGRAPLHLAAGSMLLGGGMVYEAEAEYSACVAFDDRGQLVAWHEKKVPVPAAERLPCLDWLPDFLVAWGTRIVGYVPRLGRGRWAAPLRTPSGVPFGGLVCFDNAFAWVAREHAARGARFLVVLSNEAWYRQGAELDQLLAMTVFQALETATPIVRATVDGRTVLVTADGRISGLRDAPPAGAPGWPRVLRCEFQAGPGSLGPLAWVARVLPWLTLATALAALLARRHKSCRIQSIDSPP